MKINGRIIMSTIWVLLGMVLFGLGLAGLADEFWSGMGSALFAVGILQLIRFFRFSKNEAYREKIEIESGDERNKFIRSRALAWTGYFTILFLAVSVIVLRLLGQELLSLAASYTVCFMLLLNWGCYFVLKRKY